MTIGVFIMNQSQHQEIWAKAPASAWAWERFPNQRCVWHCRENGGSFVRKAPNVDPQRTTSWRDFDMQLEADRNKQALDNSLSELNIILV